MQQLIHIRDMRLADLEMVAAIEAEVDSSWSRTAIEQELEIPHGCQLVAESDQDTRASGIVGWCAVRFIWPEAELIKIAVKKEFRRSQIGNSLLRYQLKKLESGRFTTLFLEVRAKNDSAISFYRTNSFVEKGRRRGYFSRPEDDALLYKLSLNQTAHSFIGAIIMNKGEV